MSSQEDCGLSVSLRQVPMSTTPLHIVVWKGHDDAHSTASDVTLLNKQLIDRITALEGMVETLLKSCKSSMWFPTSLHPTPTGIEVMSAHDCMGNDADITTVISNIVRPVNTTTKSLNINIPPLNLNEVPTRIQADAEEDADGLENDAEGLENVDDMVSVALNDEEEDAHAEEAEQKEAEADGLEAEEADAEEAAEEADADGLEEEIVEYKEIEWKGQTYYMDSDFEVYEMDSDGDLIETPIGLWREATQKLVRYTKA